MINKIVDSARDAVAEIRDGACLLVAGFGEAGYAGHLMDAVLEQGAKDLIVVSNNAGYHDYGLGKLIGLKRVRKLVCTFPNYPAASAFRKLYLAGEIELELVPQGTLVERIRAGGAGIGGFFTPTGAETELAEGKESRLIGGRLHVLESPIRGDFALLRGDKADRWGNLTFWRAQRNYNPVMAMAADVAIAEVSEIVPLGDLDPDAIVTPERSSTASSFVPSEVEASEMANDVMRDLAAGYEDECAALHELLAPQPEAFWDTPTQFKRWTSNDVLSHLLFFDVAATLTLTDETAFTEMFSCLGAAVADGRESLEFSRRWLGGVRGRALLARWSEQSRETARVYAEADPRRRVKWAGPAMSVRSSLSARLMEIWAHAQAIYDLLGAARREGDHLRNVAELGVNTYRWSFVNRGLQVPQPQPGVRLRAASGAVWAWADDPASVERIEGEASEFCQVVTQTRNVADTSLRVEGENARRWMAIAQCFAGVSRDPPPVGSRFCQRAA